MWIQYNLTQNRNQSKDQAKLPLIQSVDVGY